VNVPLPFCKYNSILKLLWGCWGDPLVTLVTVCWLNTQEPAGVNKSVGGATIIIKYLR
jgi:hypothetical protein